MAFPQVLVVTRLVGLHPFDNAGRFSHIWAVISCFVLSIASTCRVSAHLWFRNKYSHRFLSIENLIEDINTVLHVVIPFQHLWMMIVHRAKARLVFEFFHESKYTFSFKSIAVLYVTAIVAMFPAISVEYNYDIATVCAAVIYCTVHQLNLSIIAQFVAVMKILVLEFCSLNHRDLRKHSELIALSRCVNRIYGSQMILLTGFLFAELTSRAFELTVICSSNLDHYPVGSRAFVARSVAVSVFAVTTVIHVLLISRSCGATETAANEFNNKLFLLIKNDEQLCRNRKLFIYATLKPTTEFTASGFFKLGYPLVSTIISGVCSYLIILIQFRDLNRFVSRYLDQQLTGK
ncbi:hypothetical protein GE061_006518 [Apolygus lucorum]|uniref:Gustatory receptor n=1 Tax=Apolygus lucorum TaxID=248454 RepID=A0A8S9WY12_APOLU|nr:hypothetical protein GE061_006518 [Apolygus lucorum]